MKVCFETFGCKLNKAEALMQEARFVADGWEVTKEHAAADLFVVRGCSVTARAQRDCEHYVEHLRKHHPSVPVRVFGCLESKYKKDGNPDAALSADTPVPTRTARAYLKVQDGCSGKCSFCIVPKFRGVSRSENFADTLGLASRFIDAGYREIVVTGCNLALYSSNGKRLPDLLAALAELDPHGCRIRLGSLEPGGCAVETVVAMAEHPNVCRFLHLPVQSGSDRILVQMRRSYLSKDVDAVVMKAFGLMPSIALGCDLMAGFPDETEVDFYSTLTMVARHHYVSAHVFPYSERPGTRAASLDNALPPPIRSDRARRLAAAVMPQRERYAADFRGKVVEVVVEDEERHLGWTGEHLRCQFHGKAPRKSIASVLVSRVSGDLLLGRIK